MSYLLQTFPSHCTYLFLIHAWRHEVFELFTVQNLISRSVLLSLDQRWCKGVIIPHNDQYKGRPTCPEMDDVTFNEYFENYVREERKTTQFMGNDSFSCPVHKRAKPVICRYTDCSPGKDLEGYCYNLLLSRVPFRSEEELLDPRNTEGSYFAECIRRGFITNQESLETLVSEYCMQKLYPDFHVASIVNDIVAKNPDFGDPAVDPFDGMAPPEEGGTADGDRTAAEERKRQQMADAMLQEFEHLRQIPPNADQEKVINAIVSNPKGLHVLSGPPGSGKSLTTQIVTDKLRANNKIVVLTATTGCAAVRLSLYAGTVHSCFSLPVKDGQFISPLSPSNPKFAVLRDADCFIVDEYSMLTAQVLAKVEKKNVNVTYHNHP